MMSTRIQGRQPGQAGPWLGWVYRLVRRMTGQLTGKAILPEPVAVAAHQPRLLWGVSQMEGAQAEMNSVPVTLKLLASLTASRAIGCPF